MLKLLSFSFLIVAALASSSENQQAVPIIERIAGGEVAPINSLPYQAQFLRNEEQVCGAVIVSEKWILTAAHCLTTDKNQSIITGSDLVGKGGEKHEIKKIIAHAAYDRETDDNDIALIELKENIEFDENQQPIKLATTVPQIGEIMTISGFGKIAEHGDSATSLEVTTVPVVDYETCKTKYESVPSPITENMFCAGEGPTDACEGDSGGPAVINGTLVGIVSAGMKCGDAFYPGVYTRVANYLQWIDNAVNNR